MSSVTCTFFKGVLIYSSWVLVVLGCSRLPTPPPTQFRLSASKVLASSDVSHRHSRQSDQNGNGHIYDGQLLRRPRK